MRNHSRCLSFLLSGILSVSLLAPLSSAQAAYDGSIRNLVDRVTVLTESVQTESANEEELAKLDEMQAELEDKADAKEDVSETETVSMVVTGGTINVRTGPGTNYDKITQVVSGKQVTVVGESNGWYQVTFGSTIGWLLGEYASPCLQNTRSCRPRRHGGREGRLHGDALPRHALPLRRRVPQRL